MGVRKYTALFSILLILLLSPGLAKPPNLTPHDAKTKVFEILKSHVTYKQITPEIIRRTLQNYIEELDPLKMYFIESELDTWIHPSEEYLETIKREFEKENFVAFSNIYSAMIKAIGRRDAMEARIRNLELPQNVDVSEFQDVKWTRTEDELFDRLLRIRALQADTAEKLDESTKEQFFQRLEKRRITREQELNLSSAADREKQELSYILKAVSSALDAHTAYFTPAEASQFMIQVQQRLFGIGAQLRDDLSGFTIVRLLDGGPAILSNKLKTGDKIVAVNKEPVAGMDIFEAVELIRGPKGSKVHLTILREQEEEAKNCDRLEIEIMRDEIVLTETRFETDVEPYGDGVVAYVKLFSFYQDPNSSSASDLKNAIEKIKSKHRLHGIILDLRNNAGGLLPQAVNVAGLFISKGVVVSIKDNSGKIQHLRNFNQIPVWDGPLLVLINRGSASAAEIVAQSLQDYGRALVIGDDHSFGKGSYQTFTLESANQSKINPQGEYKVTRGMYFTVSGKSPQLIGTKSDIIIPGVLSELEIGEEFAKFPLQNDHISANFEDTFSDIHPLHRPKLRRLYKQGKQERVAYYQSYLEILKQNSKNRVENNHNYQNLLKEIKKKDHHVENTEHFGQNDLQLEEAVNVLKDLIFLEKQHGEKRVVVGE